MYFPHTYSPMRLIPQQATTLVLPPKTTILRQEDPNSLERSFVIHQPHQTYLPSYSYMGPALTASGRKPQRSGHKKTVSSFVGNISVTGNLRSNNETLIINHEDSQKIKSSLIGSIHQTPKRGNFEPESEQFSKSKTEQKPNGVLTDNSQQQIVRSLQGELDASQQELQELRKIVPQVDRLVRENEILRFQAQKADDLQVMSSRLEVFLNEASKLVEIPPQFISTTESFLERTMKLMYSSEGLGISSAKSSNRRLNEVHLICKRIEELRKRRGAIEAETNRYFSLSDSHIKVESGSKEQSPQIYHHHKELEELRNLGEKLVELTEVVTQERELKNQLLDKADELYSRNIQLEKMIQDQQQDLRDLRDQRDRGLTALHRIEDYKALNISYIEERSELLKSNEELTALAQELNEKLEYILDENCSLRESLEKNENEVKDLKRLVIKPWREDLEHELKALREDNVELKNQLEALGHENKVLEEECEQKEAKIRMWEEHNDLLTREMDEIRAAFDEYKQSRMYDDASGAGKIKQNKIK